MLITRTLIKKILKEAGLHGAIHWEYASRRGPCFGFVAVEDPLPNDPYGIPPYTNPLAVYGLFIAQIMEMFEDDKDTAWEIVSDFNGSVAMDETSEGTVIYFPGLSVQDW